jgi:hypothetical protein
MWDDCRITASELCAAVGIREPAVISVIREVSFRKVCAEWVPKILTVEQKVTRENMCAEHLQLTGKDGGAFISRIITDDGSWFHHYDPVTKIL